MRLEVNHLCDPYPGETTSGDIPFCFRRGEGVLFGVVDVLGHGAEAAQVAQKAYEIMADCNFAGQGARACLLELHEGLRGTRGAAATLCLAHGGRLDVCGVGNVGARARGASLGVHCAPGVVGRRLGKIRVGHMLAMPGARLVLHSDGIRGGFTVGDLTQENGQALCARLMREQRRVNDDATALVADFWPGEATA